MQLIGRRLLSAKYCKSQNVSETKGDRELFPSGSLQESGPVELNSLPAYYFCHCQCDHSVLPRCWLDIWSAIANIYFQ